VLSESCRRALLVLAVAVLVMTLALEAPQINTVGPYFQGRYILPLLVGFPLIACCFEWRGQRFLSERTLARSALILGIVLFAGQISAFNHALDVYKVGHLLPASWSPPGGELPVQIVFAIGLIVTLSLVTVSVA